MNGTDSPAWRGSRIATALRRALARSDVVERLRAFTKRARTRLGIPVAFDAWTDDATVTTTFESFQRAAGRSGIVRAVREGTDWARNSFLYRWLTAEPEPDVVVIDLRETFSIGPLIALLDTVVRWLVPYWMQSFLKRLLDESVRVVAELAETKIGRAIAGVLTPPEVPRQERKRNDHERDSENSGNDA